ncbi:MAG: 50S ribosomal protein L30 [Chloroflexi bacterium]|nr:50S ribosomal protein L30 [Chloroflexota bacterium]
MLAEQQRVRVQYSKSAIGYSQRQKATVRALGLRRLGDTVEHTLNPALAGMIQAVKHLVTVEYLDEGAEENETT